MLRSFWASVNFIEYYWNFWWVSTIFFGFVVRFGWEPVRTRLDRSLRAVWHPLDRKHHQHQSKATDQYHKVKSKNHYFIFFGKTQKDDELLSVDVYNLVRFKHFFKNKLNSTLFVFVSLRSIHRAKRIFIFNLSWTSKLSIPSRFMWKLSLWISFICPTPLLN